MSLGLNQAGLLVILSPHGSRNGLYARVTGSLASFGVTGIDISLPCEDVITKELADLLSWPVLEDEIDHGISVPLLLAEITRVPVVAGCVAEGSADTTEAGARFARALEEVADEQTVFVASANGSAGLSPRAPLTEIETAGAIEEKLLTSLQDDVGELEQISRRLAEEAGSCGAGPLAAFAHLFSGRHADVLAHECPVGVGYTVAGVGDG